PACGTTQSRLATDPVLVSDAVDHAISEIDFRSLAGEKVFFDTRYLVNVKGVGFVNSEYVISSLRQQMIAADVRLQDKPDDAEYVVEARVGTLGTDGNEIIYGIPANRGLNEAASLLPNAPALPAIPELSLARKESQFGAVKVAAYAYARKSGEPVWQSGVARAKTSSQDVWLFGAGPFQQGSIHQKTTFAGNEIHLPGARARSQIAGGPPVPFDQEFYFQNAKPGTEDVQTVQHTEPVTKPAEPQLVEPLAPGTPLIPPIGPLLPIPAAGTAPVPGVPPAGANPPPPAKG
ncbi:MAG: DUF6655 family protein, partial [Pirellulaceae bacterium]